MGESLNAKALALIETLADNLYSATLVGNPAPIVERLGDRMRHPQVGDLVLEVTTLYRADRAGTRLGRLVRITEEPMFTSAQWYDEGGARPDEPIPTERAWYIALPDGREFRWHNARFIAVPTADYQHDTPFVSDPTALFAETTP